MTLYKSNKSLYSIDQIGSGSWWNVTPNGSQDDSTDGNADQYIGGDRNPNIWAYSELYDLFHSVVVVIIKWDAFRTAPSVVIYIVPRITTIQPEKKREVVCT